MKTYEITFMDLGFFISPEFWLTYLGLGFVMAWVAILEAFEGGPVGRMRTVRYLQGLSLRQYLILWAAVIGVWWYALWWYLGTVIGNRRWVTGICLCAALIFVAPLAAKADESFMLSPDNLVRIYDGDTFYVNLPGLPPVFGEELGIRIKHIDTPEKRSGCDTEAQKVQERALAREARAILAGQLQQASTITLTELTRDKYFRLNATVLVDGQNVTDRLIATQLAVPYDGGTKISWCDGYPGES